MDIFSRQMRPAITRINGITNLPKSYGKSRQLRQYGATRAGLSAAPPAAGMWRKPAKPQSQPTCPACARARNASHTGQVGQSRGGFHIQMQHPGRPRRYEFMTPNGRSCTSGQASSAQQIGYLHSLILASPGCTQQSANLHDLSPL